MVSSDREQWQNLYKVLKLLLRKQQSQLVSIEKQRRYLELQNKISIAQISQMKRQLGFAELAETVQLSKANLVKSFVTRESLVYKKKLEHAESELCDFKALFDILSPRCPDQEDISPTNMYDNLKKNKGKYSTSKRPSANDYKTLENELAKLKREYERLSLASSSEKSALEDKIKFVWNQYEEMERRYTEKLQAKCDEVDKENEKTTKLIENLEQLQSLNTEKDEKVNNLEAEVNKRDEEISRLQKELESVKSTRTFAEPVLKQCGSSFPDRKTRSATARGKGRVDQQEDKEKNKEISEMLKEKLKKKSVDATPVLGEPSSSRLRNSRNRGGKAMASSIEPAHEQGQGSSRQSKRKQSNVEPQWTPKLFTGQFKVPKLKSEQSARGR